MEKAQRIQEAEYTFPYHYIVAFGDGHFSQTLSDTWGANYAAAAEYVLAQVEGRTRRKIIDIGCGDGRLAREIALRITSAQVLGVDYSERAIGLARAMNHGIPELEFISADITLEDLARKHDCATLVEVLEHVPPHEAPAFLAGIARLLEPGADLFVTVPHANKPLEPKHFRHFTVDGLAAELGGHFEVVRMMPFERRAWSRWLLARLMHNRLFALTNPLLLERIYAYHVARLFHCQERDCQRIFAHVTLR